MRFFIQELVNGITQGSLYALIALGYSMVYGVLKLLNFAHGDLYMVGAFIGYFVIQWFGGPMALSIPVPLLLLLMFLLAGGGVGALGVAIERFAYRPLRDAPRIAPLITALGVSFFLENAMLLLFGASYREYNTSAFISFSTGIHIGVLNIDIVRIMVIVLSVLLMIGLTLLVNRTKLGKQMRAVAADREAAEMLGIDVDYVIAATFFRLPRSAKTATGMPQAIWATAPAKMTAPIPTPLRWKEFLILGERMPMPLTMVSVTMADTVSRTRGENPPSRRMPRSGGGLPSPVPGMRATSATAALSRLLLTAAARSSSGTMKLKRGFSPSNIACSPTSGSPIAATR